MNKNDGNTDRVVFLDVDGPIINTPMFYLDPMCSMKRTLANTQAVAYVKRLLQVTKSKLVMNTTHNNHPMWDEFTQGYTNTVRDYMVHWGMPTEYFHADWRTNYPNTKRGAAVDNWLYAHGDPDWIAFDDDKFTDDMRLVLIDFDRGVDYAYYRKAMKLFGRRDEPRELLL